MSEDKSTKAVALRYMASFATGDPDQVAANVTEDFVNTQTGALGKGCETREVYRGRLKGFLGSFVGLKYEPVDVIENGGKVAITYRMRAESDGHPIDIPGVMVVEVRDGLVAGRQDYWDGLTFLQQTKQA
ncbi:nuclear transport factor 2 family protein [Hyphococcus lacteus]|uniref:Nuclear transport factor 2 family protein n=1 Tax=Hyphococcus lacteus TaxID=3143536 RepID=A0ABV3Z4P5_9PROT